MVRPGVDPTRMLSISLAAVGTLALVIACYSFISSSGFAYDFRAYDFAARRVAAGGALYPPGVADAYNAGQFGGLYLYSPPPALALLPLTAVDSHTAALLFLVLRIVLLAAGCAIMPVSRVVRAAVFGVSALSLPVLYDLNLGNVSVILLAAGAALWRWKDARVGAVIAAAAITVRPSFAIVPAWWLFRRRFALLGAVIVAGAIIVALTLPIVGIAGYADYVTMLRGLGPTSTGPHNVSLSSSALALGATPTIADVALYAGYALAVVVAGFGRRRSDPDASFVATVTSTLIATPFIHSHYMTLLILPAALLADRGWWWALTLPLLCWLVPEPLLPLLVVAAIGLTLLAPAQRGSRLRSQTLPYTAPSASA